MSWFKTVKVGGIYDYMQFPLARPLLVKCIDVRRRTFMHQFKLEALEDQHEIKKGKQFYVTVSNEGHSRSIYLATPKQSRRELLHNWAHKEKGNRVE